MLEKVLNNRIIILYLLPFCLGAASVFNGNTVFITGLLLSVLLVITLISSQFGNLLNQVNEKNTIERVEAVVDALDNSSSLIQVHILEAANGGGLSFTLDKEPIIKKTDKNNCNHKLSTLEKIPNPSTVLN